MAVITLVTMGSWGDLFPFVGLARELARRGHDVRLAASPAWDEVVADTGVPFVGVGRPLGFDELRQHPEIFRRVPLGLRHALDRFVFDQIDELTTDLRLAMDGADLVVVHPAHIAALNVAEHLDLPRVVATVFPGMIPSASTVPGGTPIGPWSGRLGQLANRLAWRNARVGTAILFDRKINRHRRVLDLAPLRAGLFALSERARATVVMASRHVIEPPPDWPESVTVTSFVEWDTPTGRPMDPATRAFLDAGEPPVLVTLGSNGAIEPEDFFDHAARLVRNEGPRAVVATGPGPGVPALEGVDGVHVTAYAPFGELMPRCLAAVHHGGVGTAVAAIRAGLPQVVVPRGFDQPDTADRLVALGVGRAVSWRSRRRRLPAAMHAVLADKPMAQAAAALASEVASEDGTALSADAIETQLF